MFKNRVRARFEPLCTDEDRIVICSSFGENVERIIWEQGGAISKLEPDSFLVKLPAGASVVDAESTPHIEYDCCKWTYTIPSKDKLIWISAVCVTDESPPVLQREMSPWAR